MTVNGEHLISDVIRVCGGRNVFSDLPALTPQVTREAVLAVDPDVMVAGSEAGMSSQPLAIWRDWPELRAVQAGRLYLIPRDLLVRHTPRILDGTERLCRLLEAARQADTADITRETP